MSRELDIRILLEVMGGKVTGNPRGNQELLCPKGFRLGSRRGCNSEWNLIGYVKTDLPDYSSSISDAWLVVEKMREKFDIRIFAAENEVSKDWHVLINSYERYGPSLPQCICEAALAALQEK